MLLHRTMVACEGNRLLPSSGGQSFATRQRARTFADCSPAHFSTGGQHVAGARAMRKNAAKPRSAPIGFRSVKYHRVYA
jgi:hypothetical protein